MDVNYKEKVIYAEGRIENIFFLFVYCSCYFLVHIVLQYAIACTLTETSIQSTECTVNRYKSFH